jgi:hypothetical protein
MAAGVLKFSLGECYVPTLAAKLGCKLPATALSHFDQEHGILKQKSNYKTSILGKRTRARAQVALKKLIIQPGSVVDDFGIGCYVSSGKGLLLAMSETTPES